jgi:hypothetical protein
MEGMLIASLIRIIPRSFFEGLPSSNDWFWYFIDIFYYGCFGQTRDFGMTFPFRILLTSRWWNMETKTTLF